MSAKEADDKPSRRRAGDSGSQLDALTGPLPLLVGMATAAVVLLVQGPVTVAAMSGVAVWVGASIPGLSRAGAVRTTARAEKARAAERRLRAIGSRLEPWERLGEAASDSADRFTRAAERCRAGPLRDRIEGMRPEVDQARVRVEALVALGIDLEEAIADRPPPERAKGRRRWGAARERDDAVDAGRGSRSALERQREEVHRRARDIDASLSAAVAVAFELALDSVHADAHRGIDALVEELETLSDALAELRTRPDPTS